MTDQPTALHAVLSDDPGDRVDIPTRLVLRHAGSDRAVIADKFVTEATAWFQCDPFDLVAIDLAPVRYSKLSTGADWVEVEATFTTRAEINRAVGLEHAPDPAALLARIEADARARIASDL